MSSTGTLDIHKTELGKWHCREHEEEHDASNEMKYELGTRTADLWGDIMRKVEYGREKTRR